MRSGRTPTVMNLYKYESFAAVYMKAGRNAWCLVSRPGFHILDHASTTFQLKIKEAIHIQREQPSLNQQLHQVNLKLSF